MADRHWTEQFRWITPVLVSIAIFILGGIKADLTKIDEKMFKHLTNDEVHCPRTIVVTKPEFQMYQAMRDKQMEDLKDYLIRIERYIERVNGNK